MKDMEISCDSSNVQLKCAQLHNTVTTFTNPINIHFWEIPQRLFVLYNACKKNVGTQFNNC